MTNAEKARRQGQRNLKEAKGILALYQEDELDAIDVIDIAASMGRLITMQLESVAAIEAPALSAMLRQTLNQPMKGH